MVILTDSFTVLQLVPHKRAISWGTWPKNYVVSVALRSVAVQCVWSSLVEKTTLTTQMLYILLFYYSSWGTPY